MRTSLEGAYLTGANLEGASLWRANLEGVSLWRAVLKGASLQDANLRGASLQEADLRGARGLIIEQLATVKTLLQAQLDSPLKEEVERRYPRLLEKP